MKTRDISYKMEVKFPPSQTLLVFDSTRESVVFKIWLQERGWNLFDLWYATEKENGRTFPEVKHYL